MRHGDAEPPGAVDRDRRLTRAGRAAFASLAASLAPSLQVRRILASPFARARETALILNAATGAPVEDLELLVPGRSSGAEILSLAREAGGGAALVGHNPEIAEALALAAGEPQQVPPGTVAALEDTLGGCRLLWVRHP